MAYHQPFQVTGFHSCDREVGLKVLNGNDVLIPSENKWDWLGMGIYFWEQNPGRALEYSIEVAGGTQKNAGRIKNPFVIGAIIELGNCLNLLEPDSINLVKEAYHSLKIIKDKSGEEMPKNKGANRTLDCAVIQTLHKLRDEGGKEKYDTIRCAFQEGGEIYENSNFTERLHIEIAVINPNCIKGYFLPRPIDKFNPYLSSDYVKPDFK